MNKSRSFLAAFAAGTIVLAGCSAGSTDYKKAAEKAINDSPELEAGACVKPDSTDVGTTFDCTATVTADSSAVALVATIDKKGHVTVGLPDSSGTADTTSDSTSDTTEETVVETTTG
jgi:hypothetical protein